jgi:hypothetical protein
VGTNHPTRRLTPLGANRIRITQLALYDERERRRREQRIEAAPDNPVLRRSLELTAVDRAVVESEPHD